MVGRSPKEPLKKAPKIAPDFQAGETLEKIRFRVHGTPRNMEGDLGVTRFGSRGELGSEKSPQAPGQLCIEQQAGIEIEFSC